MKKDEETNRKSLNFADTSIAANEICKGKEQRKMEKGKKRNGNTKKKSALSKVCPFVIFLMYAHTYVCKFDTHASQRETEFRVLYIILCPYISKLTLSSYRSSSTS